MAISSHATTMGLAFKWGVLTDNSAAAMYNSDLSSDSKVFGASVDHSKSGNQKVYFSNYYAEEQNICSYENKYPDSSTIVFDGQAVKMLRWCKKFSSSKNYYYYNYTPETDRGHHYVINLFKKSVLPIKIQIDQDSINFPVTGFTKVWNSAGGNAI